MNPAGSETALERGWRRLPAPLRPAAIVVLYLVTWSALDFIAQFYDTADGVSVWYPPAALDYVLLLVGGLRYAPVLVLNTVPNEMVTSPSGLGPAGLAVYNVTTTLVPATAAFLLLRRVRIDPGLSRLRDVAWFLGVAAFAAPAVTAVVQVTNLTLHGLSPPSRFTGVVLGFWAGDATGIGMLAPALLVALRRHPGLWARPPRPEEAAVEAVRRRPRALAVKSAVLIAAVYVAYGAPRSGNLDYASFIFIPLIWIAVRHGFAATTLIVLGINVGAAFLLFDEVDATNAVALQFGLMGATLTGLLLGAVASERDLGEAKLRHHAFHDALTGLPNHRLFLERLGRAVRRAGREGAGAVAVLFLDLDRFKTVNDGLGRAAGDRLLAAIGARLVDRLRPGDTVARLGGDEFALLIDGAANAEAAGRVAARVLDAFAAPFAPDGREVQVSTGVGVALSAGPDDDPESLMRRADLALHRAKARGGACYALFDREMHARVLERLELERDLRGALQRDDLRVHYQPVVDLDGPRAVGVEALARWRHPTRGPVGPAEFIALAEETALIRPLGAWALRTACADLRAWQAATGRDDLYVAVNVSMRQTQDAGFAADVLRVLGETGLAPADLRLELTESVFLERRAGVVAELRRLAASGVAVVIDDFGTGFSSLGYLGRLPVRGVKIDRSFVEGLPAREDNAAIVRTVLALAASLRLEATAEGVETAEQAVFLRENGCRRAQGFLFGAPAPSIAAALAGVEARG